MNKQVNFDLSQKKPSENNGNVNATRKKLAKVAPASGVPYSEKPKKWFSRVAPLRGWNKDGNEDPQDAVKCQFKLFIFGLSLLFITLGIGLTIHGSKKDLNDFLVLGPGCIIIAIILTVVGGVVICRDIYRRAQLDKSMEVHIMENDRRFSNLPDYDMPGLLQINKAQVKQERRPSVIELYGENNVHQPARPLSSKQGSIVTTSDLHVCTTEQSDSAPSLVLPQDVGREQSSHNATVYTIPIRVQSPNS